MGISETELQETVKRIIENELGVCQSALVDALMDEGFDGFSYEDVEVQSPDFDKMDVAEIKEWFDNEGLDIPSGFDIWSMTDEELNATMVDDELDGHDQLDKYCKAQKLEIVLEAFDDEALSGMDLQEFRDAAQEAWQDMVDNNEVLEWWIITDSRMKKNLAERGEHILDNDYGTWWGRTCSGQSISCDWVMQDIAKCLLERVERLAEKQ